VNTPLEVTDGAARIRFAQLALVSCSSPTDLGQGPGNGIIVIDHLLYARPRNPPPRESDPPIINITFPTNGSVVEGVVPGETRLTVQANVIETAILGMTAQVNNHAPMPVFYFRTGPQTFNVSVELSAAEGLVGGSNKVVLEAIDFD